MTFFDDKDQEKIRVEVTLNLSKEALEIIDKLKMEYGASTRGRTLELLIQDLIAPE